MTDNPLGIFHAVRQFIFDIDGVLTDGSLLIQETGELLRSMNIRDGYALQHAVKMGYQIGIISGASGLGLKTRLQGLGIQQIYLGIQDKRSQFQLLENKGLFDRHQTLYMGDDIPDLFVMDMVSLPCCPSDASPEIIKVSRYVSPFPGGKGCVRDVIEKVLKLQGHWAV